MAVGVGSTERGSNAQMLQVGCAQANLLSLIRDQIQLSRHRELQFRQLHLHQTADCREKGMFPV